MNIVQLVMGDWSGDGHSQTETHIVLSNKTSEEIIKDFQAGLFELGLEPSDKWSPTYLPFCKDYEDRMVFDDVVEIFKNSGFEFSGCEEEEDEPIRIDGDMYFAAWKFVAKLGDPELVFEPTSLETVNIGGYGLFQS